jgi:hypothetical protein
MKIKVCETIILSVVLYGRGTWFRSRRKWDDNIKIYLKKYDKSVWSEFI